MVKIKAGFESRLVFFQTLGVGWLLWPSSDDLEAIGHGFGGRQ
jgi:hypothetical protein